jgi:hypothetical protein
MILHTFRMGMVCDAGTSIPCGGVHGAGNQPTGAFATSAAVHTADSIAADGGGNGNVSAFFSGWQYHEDALAYNWSIPTAPSSGSTSYSPTTNHEILRRRERPWLLFDDGKVYLFTCASPSNVSIQMYTHVQEISLPAGLGPPPVFA